MRDRNDVVREQADRYLKAKSWLERRRVLESSPELMSVESTQILMELLKESKGTVRFMQYMTLLGIVKDRESEGMDQRLAQAMFPWTKGLQSYMEAPTVEESKRLVEAFPDLLLEESDEMFDEVLKKSSSLSENMRQFFKLKGQLLRDTREVGVDKAFGRWKSIVSEETVEAKDALDKMRDMSKEQPHILPTTLAMAHVSTYEETRDPSELTESVKHLNEAIEKAQNAAVRATLIGQRATNLVLLFNHKRDRNSLNKAISDLQSVINEDKLDPQVRAVFKCNLSMALVERYMIEDTEDDLKEAKRLGDELIAAIETTSEEHKGFFLNCYSYLLRQQYMLSGDPLDLEHAIEYCEKAILSGLQQSAPVWQYHADLGMLFMLRFRRTHSKDDINRAVTECERGVKLWNFPPEQKWQQVSAPLVVVLYQRYSAYPNARDLSEAIRICREARETCGKGSTSEPSILGNLSIGLAHRYHRDGKSKDLNRSIRLYQEALDVIDNETGSSAELAPSLSSLSQLLYMRHEKHPEKADLARAIELLDRAIRIEGEDSPHSGRNLDRLGSLVKERFKLYGSPDDLDECIAKWELAVEKFQRDFATSPLNYRLGQTVAEGSVYARLVASLHERDKGPDGKNDKQRALEICEASKSRILSRFLSKASFAAPTSIPALEAEEESKLLRELMEFESGDLQSHGLVNAGDRYNDSRRFKKQKECRDRLIDLWSRMEAYGQDAAEYVALRRADACRWEELSRVLADLGDDVGFLSLFTTKDGIFSFFCRAKDNKPVVHYEPLPLEEVQKRYLSKYKSELLEADTSEIWNDKGTSSWQELGNRILGPLESLISSIRHVVVSPHGYLHQIPIHCLWLNEAKKSLLDEVSVSYTQGLASLLRILKADRSEAVDSVVLGYTGADLTTKEGQAEKMLFEEETTRVGNWLSTKALWGPEAVSGVLEANSSTPLKALHLCCHGLYSPSNPLDSTLGLADGKFRARDWLKLRMEVELITMSSCQVGMGETIGGDEIAGFFQVMLSAGGRAGVAGLWSVKTLATRYLMDDFYRRVCNRSESVSKAEALQQAALSLRKGELFPKEWNLKASHPYLWGPFCLYGDWR